MLQYLPYLALLIVPVVIILVVRDWKKKRKKSNEVNLPQREKDHGGQSTSKEISDFEKGLPMPQLEDKPSPPFVKEYQKDVEEKEDLEFHEEKDHGGKFASKEETEITLESLLAPHLEGLLGSNMDLTLELKLPDGTKLKILNQEWKTTGTIKIGVRKTGKEPSEEEMIED